MVFSTKKAIKTYKCNRLLCEIWNANLFKIINHKTIDKRKKYDNILLENFVENNVLPDPDVVFPVPNVNAVTYVKPTIKN
jgi:hypothetical protein